MTTTILTTLVGIECYKCHVLFGLTADHQRKVLETGLDFYCPNGHGQRYTRSEVQRLKDELEAKERALKWERDALQRQRDMRLRTERQLYAQKGVTTKLKRRIANGVCPCCNRHFANLERHIKGQHPEFDSHD